MRELPFFARIYVGGVIAAGGSLFVYLLPQARFEDPMLFAVLLGLASLSSTFRVSLPLSQSGSSLSVSYAVDVAALLLLGPHETMIVAAISAWSQCALPTKESSRPCRTLFSMACLVITVQAAGVVYAALGGRPGAWTFASLAKPLVGAAATYFLLNTVMIASAIALSMRASIAAIWAENFLWSAPSYFVGALAAALAAGLIDRSGHWLAPLAALPLYLTYRTYRVYVGRIEDQQRHLEQVSELHLATIEALARAVEAKDQTSHTHIRRVQTYAVALARAAGLTQYDELQGVKTAAVLHDIGKLAVPEHILSKPGPLTEEEFQKVRIHPTVGAEIVAAVPFPYPVAPLIQSHHERWDGTGYPAGLKGEEIPLGARILAVADTFDALMADRPYKRAMSSQEAAALLEREAGKALDPKLVAAFVALLPELEANARAAEPAAAAVTVSNGEAPDWQPAAGLSPQTGTKTVFDYIALAHREIYALYELANAVGTSFGVSDTMTVIASKLTNLVPFSCCALFLYDEQTDSVRCRFATGTDADCIRQIEVWGGHGLMGWVARNQRAIVNGRPTADFEAAGLSDLPVSVQSALVAPLIVNERFIGALTVYHVEPSFYREDHRRLLDRVCEQAAAVINNSVLFEQTEEDSLTDPLTGLQNTRYLYKHLTGELARAERLKTETAVMVMDLDHFKGINDLHGHQAGDRALCEVARALQSAIRQYDICVRYAGDEFVIVLADCSAEQAQQRSLAIQRLIDTLAFEARPGKRIHLGISVGLAMSPADGASCDQLLAVADKRMYENKGLRHRGGERAESERDTRVYLHEFSGGELDYRMGGRVQ